MKKIAALSALAVMAVAGTALGQVTGQIEYRFVTVAGTGALPNQGTGLANGTVLGPNTLISADNALIRQRVALQVRTINIGGTFSTQSFNGSNTALEPGVVLPAQNLGIFSVLGGVSMGDGSIVNPSLAFAPWTTTQPGMVAGSSWNNFQGVMGTGTLPAQVWPWPSANPPAPNNPANNGAGGAWVEVSRFFWESSDLTPRTIAGAFAGLGNAYVGNGVASASFPDPDEELNGSVTYTQFFASGLQQNINGFSFLIQQGQTNEPPTSMTFPAVITADPFVNPDALNLVLASFSDPDGDNVSVMVTNDGGIGALGGALSIGGTATNPTIVLNWDAPNAAIGNTYTVQFSFSDGELGGTGSVTVQVIPAPGALALLGLGGLVAGRRRRA
ncbi:MAG: hypothetical protein KF768_00670 [Phycisphaeraceae bacterium]|nr:hypothetical protein [Phycisphaeraceae bacterium]